MTPSWGASRKRLFRRRAEVRHPGHLRDKRPQVHAADIPVPTTFYGGYIEITTHDDTARPFPEPRVILEGILTFFLTTSRPLTLSSDELEATAPSISGHARCMPGEGSRPNVLTLLITMNASLSKDIAERRDHRTRPPAPGTPRPGRKTPGTSAATHRWEILAEIAQLLAGPPGDLPSRRPAGLGVLSKPRPRRGGPRRGASRRPIDDDNEERDQPRGFHPREDRRAPDTPTPTAAPCC